MQAAVLLDVVALAIALLFHFSIAFCLFASTAFRILELLCSTVLQCNSNCEDYQVQYKLRECVACIAFVHTVASNGVLPGPYCNEPHHTSSNPEKWSWICSEVESWYTGFQKATIWRLNRRLSVRNVMFGHPRVVYVSLFNKFIKHSCAEDFCYSRAVTKFSRFAAQLGLFFVERFFLPLHSYLALC